MRLAALGLTDHDDVIRIRAIASIVRAATPISSPSSASEPVADVSQPSPYADSNPATWSWGTGAPTAAGGGIGIEGMIIILTSDTRILTKRGARAAVTH